MNQPGYDGTIPISGGTGGYRNLTVKGLPPGLVASVLSSVANVNGSAVQSGLISITGTPTRSGTFPLVVSLTDAVGATDPDNYTLTVNPAAVDLQVSVNGSRIVPVKATDLNLSFFFGTEQVRVPVTFGNAGPDVLKGNVTLNLFLAQNADGSGTRVPLSAPKGASPNVSQPVSLNLPAHATHTVNFSVTIPTTAGSGTEYYVVAAVSLPANMTDANPNNNTAGTSQKYEFLGTPRKTQIFNHDSAASAINTTSPPFGYYAYVRAAITNNSYDFGSVLNDGQNFTAHFEGLRLWPYLDSKGIPTLGYGINLGLGSIHSIPGLETALVNAVADYVNANPTLVNARLKKLIDNGSASTHPDAIITELSTEAAANGSASGSTLRQQSSRPGLDVLTATDALSVFGVAYQVKANAAQKAFNAFAKSNMWDQLSAGEKIALIDIQFNTMSGIPGFPSLLTAIKNGDPSRQPSSSWTRSGRWMWVASEPWDASKSC